MINRNCPLVSVIMPTFNSDKVIKQSLISIREQNYPQNKIEIIIVDGGSTDKTLKIAQNLKCKIVNAGYKDDQEMRRGIGLSIAKGEIIAVIDSDNILPNKTWITDLVKPFIEVEGLVFSQPLYYHYEPKDSIFNRYCALFGVNDPVVLYLGKADRIPHYYKKWTSSKIIKRIHNYIVTEFTKDNLPTVGCNGFLIKKRELLKSNWKNGNYFHIDVVYDLTNDGPIKGAIVNQSLWHKTSSNFTKFIKKRFFYFDTYSNTNFEKRRYFVFSLKNKQDVKNLILYTLASLTLIYPTIQALRGYIAIRDNAWFIHPFFCFIFFWIYTYTYLKKFVKKIFYG